MIGGREGRRDQRTDSDYSEHSLILHTGWPDWKRTGMEAQNFERTSMRPLPVSWRGVILPCDYPPSYLFHFFLGHEKVARARFCQTLARPDSAGVLSQERGNYVVRILRPNDSHSSRRRLRKSPNSFPSLASRRTTKSRLPLESGGRQAVQAGLCGLRRAQICLPCLSCLGRPTNMGLFKIRIWHICSSLYSNIFGI